MRALLEVNDCVKFKIFVDPAKGQPKALDLEAASPQAEACSPKSDPEASTQDAVFPLKVLRNVPV